MLKKAQLVGVTNALAWNILVVTHFEIDHYFSAKPQDQFSHRIAREIVEFITFDEDFAVAVAPGNAPVAALGPPCPSDSSRTSFSPELAVEKK